MPVAGHLIDGLVKQSRLPLRKAGGRQRVCNSASARLSLTCSPLRATSHQHSPLHRNTGEPSAGRDSSPFWDTTGYLDVTQPWNGQVRRQYSTSTQESTSSSADSGDQGGAFPRAETRYSPGLLRMYSRKEPKWTRKWTDAPEHVPISTRTTKDAVEQYESTSRRTTYNAAEQQISKLPKDFKWDPDRTEYDALERYESMSGRTASDASEQQTTKLPEYCMWGAGRAEDRRYDALEQYNPTSSRTLFDATEQRTIDLPEYHKWDADRTEDHPPISRIRYSKVDSHIGKTTEDMYRQLRVAAGGGAVEVANNIVDTLVRRRGEEPSMKFYGPLLLVNIAAKGSAAQIKHILDEIKEEGLACDAETYHFALKALAVHPDFLTRAEILQDMKDRWLDLTPPGWHDVVVGYTREGQLEMAFETLEDMRSSSIPVKSWLYDMLMFRLCDAGEVGDALRLLKQRVDDFEVHISAGIWYYLFDAACTRLHHETLQYVWQRRIEPSYLNPTNGHCLAVLNSASRCGDVSLSTDVFRVLSDRNFHFTGSHYEMLLGTYLQAGDFKTALTITCIMAGAQLELDPSSLSPILMHLKTDVKLPKEALELCKEMVNIDQRTFPTPVITCMIEAACYHGTIDDAITIYKTLHQLSPAGPDVNVFNVLFRGCHYAAELAYNGKLPDFIMPAVERPADTEEKPEVRVALPETNPGREPIITEPPAASPGTETKDIAPKIPITTPSTPTPTAPPPEDLDPYTIKETAMFLASEMVYLRIKPTQITYDRLLLTCLHQDDCRDAFKYYAEMLQMNLFPRGPTIEQMIRRLKQEDEKQRKEKKARAEAGEGSDEVGGDGVGDKGRDITGWDGRVGSVVGEEEGAKQTKKGVLERPMERAWTIVSAMKERRMLTDRVERILMDVEEDRKPRAQDAQDAQDFASMRFF